MMSFWPLVAARLTADLLSPRYLPTSVPVRPGSRIAQQARTLRARTRSGCFPATTTWSFSMPKISVTLSVIFVSVHPSAFNRYRRSICSDAWLRTLSTKSLSPKMRSSPFTLTLQKSRVLQIQGVKGAAVVIYRKPLTTLEMRCHRLSRRVNNRAVFY